jgi:hypothetical protein
MHFRLETITPKKAAEFLTHNVSNRPLSPGRIDTLSEAIVAGQYRVNGDAIKFDTDGNLIDGQHRCHAVLVANKSIETYVCRGVEPCAFDTIDNVNPRRNSDRLARDGEKHYCLLAAAIARVWQYENGLSYSSSAPRPDQMRKTLSKSSGLRDACDLASRCKSKILPGSDAAFCIYYTRKLWGEAKADPFWVSVLTVDNLKAGTPAHTLYKRLYDHTMSVAKLPKAHRVGLCIKAFNAYITGTKLRCLKIGEDEDAPRFLEPKR